MNNEINTKKVLDMLGELAACQAQNLKCDAILFKRDKEKQILECVDSAKKEISEKAHMFGVKMEKIATEFEGKKTQVLGILDNYKDAMESAAKPFDEAMKGVMAQQSEVQADFISLVANFIPTLAQQQGQVMKVNAETKKATKEVLKAIAEKKWDKAIENLDKAQKLEENHQPEAVKTVAKSNLEQMKAKLELIKECKREKEGIKERRKAAINKVKAEKMMQLQVSTKNIVKRIMGSLFGKFNGTKKFLRTAVDPLKNTITEIKETHIPNIKAGIANKMEDFRESFENNKMALEEAVTQKVDQYAEKLAATKEGVMSNIKSTKEKIQNGIKDAAETAQIEAMIAKGFINDKIETAQIYGMEAKDKVTNKIQTAKDWVADKVETAQIYGMEAKDEVIARKNAILEGAVNIKNSVMEKAEDVKDGVVKMATETRDGVANTVTSAKNLIVKGATTIGDAGKNTYKSLINKGLQVKMNIVASIQRRLEEQQKQLQEKMTQLNPDQDKTDTMPIL